MYPIFKYSLCIIGLAQPLVFYGETGAVTSWLPDETSFRFGFSATSPSERFREYRLACDWDFPFADGVTGNWIILPRLDLSAGALDNPDDTAFIASIGPAVRVGYRDWPVFLEGTFCPTFISTHSFGDINLGVDFQFTSSLGVIWQITPEFSIGYKFQHMSNASISENNPGLELHVLSCAWHF